MKQSRLNLDDFPDSMYARELRKPVTRLKFSSVLEAEYRQDHLRRIETRAHIWSVLGLAIALGFTAAQWYEDRGLSFAVLLHFLVILPISAVMFWLAWMPGRLRRYVTVVSYIMPVLGIAVADAVAHAVTLGASEEIAMLTLLVVASFFFIGMLFRAALVTGLAILFTFVASGLFIDMPAALLLKCSVFLAIATALGITIGHDVELSYRRRFLERSLIDELVDRDGLTGLRNRRAFDDHLLRVWQQSLRGRTGLAIFVIDIDYFKRYNDNYGHQAGDAALRKVATVIKDFARRPLDISARFGGEEFTIVSYDIGADAVNEIAESLRAAVESLEIEHTASECSDFVTVSIGVGIVQPSIDRAPQGLIQLADEALYQAKRFGRNSYVVNGRDVYETLVTGTYQNPDFRT